ncbi:MAG TPA: phytanoyl-CoA dioxygenase family protein [Coleofasciculaceae cyanobacterium]
MSHQPVHLSDVQIAQFQEQGFLILEKFLDLEIVDQIDSRLDPLFATQLETGNYPDEWHGRPGLSKPNATRQMSGLWRCDRTIAGLSLSAEIARLNATLAGWNGGRLATDSCWIKPPQAPEVLFHRNNTAVSSINPATVVTCWIAFGEAAAGALEFVPQSHLWQCSDRFQFLHAPQQDYRQPLWDAAAEAGISSPTIVSADLPPGGCIFLHGDLWHGSGRNTSDHLTRRSFSISTLPAEACFQPMGVGQGYIYSRYRRMGDAAIDESFFPILWTSDGYRTPMVMEYCEDALSQ